MAKKRIHQIAKELDVASADIVFLANELGIEVKTASSGLTPEEEELVLLAFNEQNVTEDSTTDDTVEIMKKLIVLILKLKKHKPMKKMMNKPILKV